MSSIWASRRSVPRPWSTLSIVIADQSTMVTWPRRPKRPAGARLAQGHLRQLPVVRADRSHGHVEDHRRGRAGRSAARSRSNRSSITSVSDSRRSKRRVLTTPEITTCDGVDAAHPGHRDEDPVPGEQLDHQALDPRGMAAGPALHHDVAHLAHLVPGVVEDRQVPDPGDEDRGRRCRHGAIIPAAAEGAASACEHPACGEPGAMIDLPGPVPRCRRPWRRRRRSGGRPSGCGPTRRPSGAPGRRRRRAHALAERGARTEDGQAAGAPRPARGGRRGPGRPGRHGARRQPAVDRCWPTRRAASCAPSSASRRR